MKSISASPTAAERSAESVKFADVPGATVAEVGVTVTPKGTVEGATVTLEVKEPSGWTLMETDTLAPLRIKLIGVEAELLGDEARLKLLMSRKTVTFADSEPETALKVICPAPVDAPAPARMEKGALCPGLRTADVGVTVTPLGTFATVSATLALNPPAATRPIVTEAGWVDPIERPMGAEEVAPALAVRLKEPSETTANVTSAVCVIPPPLAVTVMLKVPAGVVAPVAMDTWTVLPAALGTTVLGLNAAVVPLGRPAVVKFTEAAKLPNAVNVKVKEAVCPGLTLAEPGEAASVKVGAVTVRVNEAVR